MVTNATEESLYRQRDGVSGIDWCQGNVCNGVDVGTAVQEGAERERVREGEGKVTAVAWSECKCGCESQASFLAAAV